MKNLIALIRIKKHISCTILLVLFNLAFAKAQSPKQNLDDGYMVKKYDVVAYFNGEPAKGNEKFTSTYNGAKYAFAIVENQIVFDKNPAKYVPQYGGYCSWTIATISEFEDINPKTYQIKDNKLYLFDNAWFSNNLKYWNRNNPDELIKKANLNWKKMQ